MWRYSPVTTGPKNSRQVRRSSRIVAPVRFWISCRRAALSEQANIAFEERENEADVENGDVGREDACCWHPRQVSQSNAAADPEKQEHCNLLWGKLADGVSVRQQDPERPEAYKGRNCLGTHRTFQRADYFNSLLHSTASLPFIAQHDDCHRTISEVLLMSEGSVCRDARAVVRGQAADRKRTAARLISVAPSDHRLDPSVTPHHRRFANDRRSSRRRPCCRHGCTPHAVDTGREDGFATRRCWPRPFARSLGPGPCRSRPSLRA